MHILYTCTWILRSLHDYKCFMLYFVSDKNLKLTSTNVPVHVHCTYMTNRIYFILVYGYNYFIL